MPRSLPPLNALRAFEAAGRHQSFSKAAVELAVSHSAISRHVRGLEDRLGAQLFRNASRGVELTRVGARYLAQISPAFDAIAAASEIFAERPKGLVTVDSEPLFAARWLIPRLGDFYKLYPDVELRLEATTNLVDVARYEADMAIRFFKKGQGVTDDPLVSDAPLYPFAAPHLLDVKTAHPKDLLQFSLLKDRATATWEHWFDLAGVDPALVPAMPWRMRATLAIEAAIAGHGVILVSADIAAGAVSAGQLVRCFDIGFRLGSYHLIVGEGAVRRSGVRAFKDWVLDQTAELRADDKA